MLFLVGPAHGLRMPRIQLYQRIPTSIAQPMGSCNFLEFTWSVRWDPSARMAAKTPLFRWCAGATRKYDSSLYGQKSREISFQSFQEASFEALGFVALGYIRSASIRHAPSIGRGRTLTQNSRIGLLELSNTMTLALIGTRSQVSSQEVGRSPRAWQISRSALPFWRTAKVAIFQCFSASKYECSGPIRSINALPTVRKMSLDRSIEESLGSSSSPPEISDHLIRARLR